MPRPSPLNDSRLITMAQYILTYHVPICCEGSKRPSTSGYRILCVMYILIRYVLIIVFSVSNPGESQIYSKDS